MNESTRVLLTDFLENILESRVYLSLNFSHITDQRRLIRIAKNLLDTSDTLDEYNVKSVCEEIGRDEYLFLMEDYDSFLNNFARPISSEINEVKRIIDIYKEMEQES